MLTRDYSHRHGKELLSLTHPAEFQEIQTILQSLKPFSHGDTKNLTPKEMIAQELLRKGWMKEVEIPHARKLVSIIRARINPKNSVKDEPSFIRA